MDGVHVVCVALYLMCMSAARTHHEPFVSSKAPREIIHNYQIVKPHIVQHSSSRDEMTIYIQSDSDRYTLHLALNVGLLSSKFASTFHTEDGTQQVQKGHQNCFYHGTVVEQPSWRVSMSTCQGLRGSFGPLADLSQHYHIEPLQSPLKSAQLDQLHVLYLGSEYRERGGICGTKGRSGEMRKPHDIPLPHQKLRRQLSFPIVEWTLVIDNTQFLQYSRNLTAVVLRSLEVANGVDLIYREEGVRLAVVDVVTWTMSDPIEIVDDPEALLDNFRDYSPNLPQNYDSVMLFTGISFTGSTIGIAFTGTMCSIQYSVGLVEDGGRDLNHVISTTAHELGHIFDMDHDDERDCECDDPSQSCIMSATLGNPPPSTWSSCSVETLQIALGGSLSRCLENQPLMTVEDPSCGNGIQEEGEECDCGTVEECVDPCCEAATCQLVLGAKCRAGQCCQPDCEFKPYGTTCRNASSECDIAEYCTGDMADCPKDVYRQDLSFCRGNSSYCYSGQCNTRDSQCMIHYLTESAIDECYTRVNTRGDSFGHCGHNDTHYIPCKEKDAFCGQIQCVPGTRQTTTGFRTTFTITVGGQSHSCQSVTTSFGSDQVSPGLIRDGTSCGDERICLSSKCVSISVVDIEPCPMGRNGEVCSGEGLCNNDNKCSCFVNSRGPACDGLRSSGGDNSGKIAGAVIGVLLVLAVIVGVSVVVGYLVWRSKSAKYIARRYIPRTVTKGTAQEAQRNGNSENSFTRVHVKTGSSSVTSQPQSRTQVQPPQRSPPSSYGRPPPPANRPPPPTRPAPPPARPPTRPPLSSTKPPSITRPPPPANKPHPAGISPPASRPPPPAPVRTPPSLVKRPPPLPQSKPAPRPAPRTKVSIQWPPPSD